MLPALQSSGERLRIPADPVGAAAALFLQWKNLILKQAFTRFEENAEFKAFVKKHAGWLTDYAHYMACKDKNDGKVRLQICQLPISGLI